MTPSSRHPFPLDSPRPHVIVRGAGPPILMLHGWGASSDLFAPAMNALDNHFTCIAPDFPGFGRTAPPPTAWAALDYARWVIDLLDALELPRVHAIGHSHGGRVLIKLATEWPERFDKLVLASSAGVMPRRTLAYHWRVRSYKALRALATSDITPAPLRSWANARAARRGSTDFQQAAATVRASMVRLVNEDLRAALPRIQAPTLLIWGDNDTETPLSDGQLMERLIPDAGLVVFEGGTHFAYIEQAARFGRIVLAFLREDA